MILVVSTILCSLPVVTPELKASLVKVLGLLKDAAESFSKVSSCVCTCVYTLNHLTEQTFTARVCALPGLLCTPGESLRPDGEAGYSSAPLPQPGIRPAHHQPAHCRVAECYHSSATMLPGLCLLHFHHFVTA